MTKIAPNSNPMRELRIKQLAQEVNKVDTGLVKLGPEHLSGSKVVTEERLYNILPELEQYYEMWLSYPDKLLYQLLPTDTSFRLYPFQTLILRVNQRYQKTFGTATRGYSKSFIAVLGKLLKCVLLPGSKESMVAEHKNQAAQIGREKINELLNLMPLLKEEIRWEKGSQTTLGEDYIRLVFKNTSEFDIVGLTDATRGGRRNGMLFEEVNFCLNTPLPYYHKGYAVAC